MRWLPDLLVASAVLVAAGAHAQEIYREKSLYRDIVVYEEQGLRCMKFGLHNTGRQSCISLLEPGTLVFNYSKMLLAALYLKPAPKKVLVIGLGGGVMSATFEKILPAATIESVELDPSVINVAKRFFGFAAKDGNSVVAEDGRVFVKRAQKQGRKYDLIVLDAFDQFYIPEHMLTREYLSEVRSLLEKDGVLAANTFSSSRLYDSESATYANVFGSFYNLMQNNRVILAKNDGLPPMSEIEANAARLEPKIAPLGTSREWLLPMFTKDVRWSPGTRVLTDQYSPANLLNGRP